MQVCEYLTSEIARNGEGVTKLITVDVSGAKTAAQAKRVAKLVANSPLVKTAVYGCDPNWGRVIMAVGKTFDPSIEPAKSRSASAPPTFSKKARPSIAISKRYGNISASPKLPSASSSASARPAARVWGCDLTEGYIKENAYYTT